MTREVAVGGVDAACVRAQCRVASYPLNSRIILYGGFDMGVKSASVESERSVAAAVRQILRGGLSVTVGTCLLVASATGAETAAKPGDLEEVIVTGIRQSLESAQEIKENSE